LTNIRKETFCSTQKTKRPATKWTKKNALGVGLVTFFKSQKAQGPRGLNQTELGTQEGTLR